MKITIESNGNEVTWKGDDHSELGTVQEAINGLLRLKGFVIYEEECMETCTGEPCPNGLECDTDE